MGESAHLYSQQGWLMFGDADWDTKKATYEKKEMRKKFDSFAAEAKKMKEILLSFSLTLRDV